MRQTDRVTRPEGIEMTKGALTHGDPSLHDRRDGDDAGSEVRKQVGRLQWTQSSDYVNDC